MKDATGENGPDILHWQIDVDELDDWQKLANAGEDFCVAHVCSNIASKNNTEFCLASELFGIADVVRFIGGEQVTCVKAACHRTGKSELALAGLVAKSHFPADCIVA